MQGYILTPTVHDHTVIFACEGDLWRVALDGGQAVRLTSGRGSIQHCKLSPDGQHVAYCSSEAGALEVFVMPAAGGRARQLTFTGTNAVVAGWSPDGQFVRFNSLHRAHTSARQLFEVHVQGGDPRQMPVGQGVWFTQQPDGPGRALGRHRIDLAYWKRYKGGLAGEIWVDRTGQDEWAQLLPEHTSGMIRPMWIGDRLWFVSDHEDHANLYSCQPDGQDLTRHTHHEGFYVRGTHTDGRTIVYTRAGHLHAYDLATHTDRRVDVQVPSPQTALGTTYVGARDYVSEFDLHPKGHSVALSARGKLFNMGLWEGAVRQTGPEHGVRLDLPRYLKDGKRLLVCTDEGGEPSLEIHAADGSSAPQALELEGASLGRPISMNISPTDDRVALTNHRHEVLLVDLSAKTCVKIDQSPVYKLSEVNWSADGQWITYSKGLPEDTAAIYVAHTTTHEVHQITTGEFEDSNPCFDPKGRYLYFVSYRLFNPSYGGMFFELGFGRGSVPCLVTLTASEASPFLETVRPLGGDGDDDEDEKDESEDTTEDEASDKKEGEGKESDDTSESSDSSDSSEEKKDKKDPPKPVAIDFDGIAQRVLRFPVPEGIYDEVQATEDRVFYTYTPSSDSTATGSPSSGASSSGMMLKAYDLTKRKAQTISGGVQGFLINQDLSTLAFYTEDGLKVVESSTGNVDDDDEDDDMVFTRSSGWIDLNRVQIEVRRDMEWAQMLREVWRVMRDQFWREDMSGVDWDGVLARYMAVLPQIATRAELSDLLWCMQGELGTSHAYEFGGDHKRNPQYRPGFLGADILWDPEVALNEGAGGWRIERILEGDSWDRRQRSALSLPGLDVKAGDVILAINAKPLSEHVGVGQRLIRQGGKEVELLLWRQGADAPHTVTVRALRSESGLRYRDWVRARRALVHERSEGKVGYIHVPDMGARGYAEFHRGMMSQMAKQGLIVDVRFNGGGNVSAFLLDKLRRRVLGYDIARHASVVEPYPHGSPRGPIVAVTNEYAGSDGDIFSHSFKMYDLGPLVGRRTWGGVIGIWPRHGFVDGTVTSQPEFSFWFEDVGFGVENYGTEPTVEVASTPGDEARGVDAQLERAIELALAGVKPAPKIEDFAPFPNLAPKPLPKA